MADLRPLINGTNIKAPHKFRVSRYNITKSGRVASGDMHMEFKAKKTKLFFTYDLISGKDLKVILDLIDTTQMFFSVTYYDTTSSAVTKTCYVGEITQELQRRGTINDNNYWKDITFDFIEK